jgi:hypothetical protein
MLNQAQIEIIDQAIRAAAQGCGNMVGFLVVKGGQDSLTGKHVAILS